jgi:L-ascorbate metabolism protein UlaG (beta-lactamase superfamily)
MSSTTQRITFIGHATVLIEMGGMRLLTDPIFGARLDDADAVLLTHAHVDHLSFEILATLPRTTPVYAPAALVAWLRRRCGANAQPLDVGDSITTHGVTITAGAARHNGARYGVDRWHSATNFYLCDDGTNSCFFAGDTALTRSANEMIARLHASNRQLDVAILPISHAPWWHPGLRHGHLTWRDSLSLFEQLASRYFVPCHWGTFRFPDSGPFDAIRRLRLGLETYPLAHRVKIIEPGESFEPPIVPPSPSSIVTSAARLRR